MEPKYKIIDKDYKQKLTAIRKRQKLIICPYCYEIVPKRDFLSVHWKQHTKKKQSYCCAYCPLTFYEKKHFNKHYNEHIREAVRKAKEKLLKCEDCDRIFNYRDELYLHQRSHAVKKTFECKMCDRSFSNPDFLKSHQASHSQNNLFECKMCKEAFLTCTDLLNHIQSHKIPRNPNYELVSTIKVEPEIVRDIDTDDITVGESRIIEEKVPNFIQENALDVEVLKIKSELLDFEDK